MIIIRNRQPQNFRKQQGWTFWSLAFTLSVIVFFAYVGMQLVPVFSANENVRNAMARSLEDVDLRTITRRKVIRKIDDQLYLDGTHGLLDYKNDIKMTRNRSSFTLIADYAREIPLFFNLSIKAKFDTTIECDLDGNCEK